MAALPRDDGQPEYLAIARISSPHGVRGEVKAEILTDFPDRFAKLENISVGPTHQPFRVESTRRHKGQICLKLAGIDTVEQAQGLRGRLIFVPVAEAIALSPHQYYWHQIIGLDVLTSDGRHLGRVVEILRTGGNDVYVVHGERREVLVPAIEDVVKEIDLPRHRMVVEPLAGMLD